jgi:hypothetical protein
MEWKSNMASKNTKTFKVTAIGFPTASATLLIGMIRGKIPFDKWKAAHAALELITYMMSYAADSYSLKAVRAPKASKKLVADTLESVINQNSSGIKASSFTIPVWLLPILIKLLLKWIENNYPAEGNKDEKKG